MASKEKKLISLQKDILSMIKLLSNHYGQNSLSTLVEILVRERAVELGYWNNDSYRRDGTDVVEIDFKKESVDISYFEEKFTNMYNQLAHSLKIINELEKGNYVLLDLQNNLLTYLKPEEGLNFVSTDISLDIKNKGNRHPFMEDSLKNYSERIKRRQINKANQ